MQLRYLIGLGSACAAVAADLAVKALVATPDWDFHRRSPAFAVVSLVLVAGAGALCALPSRLVALGAGLVAGGVAGNLISAGRHGGRVPNPVVLGNVAFTLGDVALVVGALVLTGALARTAIVHRAFIDRHIPPRRWERRLRRRLGL